MNMNQEEWFNSFNEIFDQTSNLFHNLLNIYIPFLYQCIYSFPVLNILQNNVAYISITLYLLWYFKAYLSKTELVCKDGSYMKNLIEKFPSYHSGYRPTIWCFPSISNTIVFSLLQRCIKHDYEREVLKTPDGGQIAIDWENRESAKNKLVLLVLPGLTGSSKENYVTHFVNKAKKMDCIAVVMNYRGIEVDLLTPRTYCATNHEDLHLVVQHIKSEYPEHSLFAIGISLGGMKLGGYLAKHDSYIEHAMIVSAPFNAIHSCTELEKSQYLVFNKFLTNNLSKMFDKHKHLFQNDERYDLQQIARCRSLRELDTYFTTKQFGYKTCEEYYTDACLDSKIQDIRTPTLFLNAADDMFSPERAFPLEKISSNPNTAIVATKYGGHISFTEGLIPTGCNYACRLLNDYLQNVLNDMKEK